jgi:hypothetical protein
MKESLLKKEFRQSDVNRARNLVKKDFSAKTVDGIGYTKTQGVYGEGDTWEESGRTWTIKNGIRQNVTKLDVITRLCNTNKVNWHIDNESKFVFGSYVEDLDIEYYRSIATEIGYDYIAVPSQYIQIASNISALEYTETRTKIIL